ncbi:MAG: hypothetical protein AAGN66_02310 [Acidobacteriota bacterium]
MGNVKGTAMLAVVELLRERRDHVEPLLDEGSRPYLDRQILVASWYPAQDFMSLLRTMTHFVPAAAGDPWTWLGGHSAGTDLANIYSAMVQPGNPWGTLQRLPRLWRLYHDAGKVEVGVQGSTRAQVVLSEFPMATEDFCRWMAGYLGEMLRLSGGRGIVAKTLRSAGPSHPARWLLTWEA